MSEYPTDEEVERVRAWWFDTPDTFEAFMEFVKSIGNYWLRESFGWTQEGRVFHVSTGGWSGNEEILGAMQDNWAFWTVCWQEHRRGGHYIFELPDPEVFFTKKVNMNELTREQVERLKELFRLLEGTNSGDECYAILHTAFTEGQATHDAAQRKELEAVTDKLKHLQAYCDKSQWFIENNQLRQRVRELEAKHTLIAIACGHSPMEPLFTLIDPVACVQEQLATLRGVSQEERSQ